jgi:hypothetical protein
MTHELFDQKAPIYIDALMQRYYFRDFQAIGIMGNIGHECAGFTQLRELGQPDGHGGYGWCQWTGPRAHSRDLDRPGFLVWCERRHMDWRSDVANSTYLFHDLDREYRDTVSAILKCDTRYDSCLAFERNYERAGVINMASRQHWADIAALAYLNWQTRNTQNLGVV